MVLFWIFQEDIATIIAAIKEAKEHENKQKFTWFWHEQIPETRLQVPPIFDWFKINKHLFILSPW